MAEPRIFVVDDEPETRELIGDYLAMNGYSVRLLDGGAAMRKQMETERPDLVVLDLNMPGEDGLSIVRSLKSSTDVPVIMLTATASLVDRVVGLELGADDYLAKPCELRELLARIRSVIRRAQAQTWRMSAARCASAPSGSISTPSRCVARMARNSLWSTANSPS